MRVVFLAFCLFFSAASLLGAPLCNGNPHPKSLCAGWEALQQIRSLIPERIWEQEFDLIIDKEAFQKVIPQWISRNGHDPHYVLAHSNHFFLQSTFSGENVRILDRYQEFQWSPYWKYPPRVEELRSLECQIIKGDSQP